ncbi:hypothetical protein BRD17_03795 [Halobacteriales archaeon SW_7_68_16]|nr:MAG: hypothetical protein BRD17_03795 [Halobacteriales archaeon SW_7_68_16]
MNGNTPYAGLPGVTAAGRRADGDFPELSADAKRALRRDVVAIARKTREYLPDEYAVSADVMNGVAGPRATVAVRPPAGNPVSAGFAPDDDETEIPSEEHDEVARGLVAGAVVQVRQAVDDDFTAVGR